MGAGITTFYFRSKTEGTMSPGLQSDIDLLFKNNYTNTMNTCADLQQGKINLLMVRDMSPRPSTTCCSGSAQMSLVARTHNLDDVTDSKGQEFNNNIAVVGGVAATERGVFETWTIYNITS